VNPVIRRNVVEKWLGVRNPTDLPTAAIGTATAVNNALAFSIRC